MAEKKKKRIKNDPYPCVTKLLTDALAQEKKWKASFEKLAQSSDPLTMRLAEGNIPSNTSRIDQIQQAMAILHPPEPEEEEPVA